MQIDNLVVGAGISGISAAWELQKAGKEYLICEASKKVGGCIATNRNGEFLWEEGPSSFLPKDEILSLISDAKLTDDVICVERKLPRFIFYNNKLNAVPASVLEFLTSDLLSFKGKLRLFIGLLGFIKPLPKHEESVREFFTRHLGYEVAERLVEPFVSGVYAGDIDCLTSRAVFAKVFKIAGKGILLPGIIPGLIKSKLSRHNKSKKILNPNMPKIKRGKLCNLTNGLDSLPKALIKVMGNNVRLNWQAIAIKKTQEGFVTTFKTEDGLTEVSSKNLILALPAYITANLLQGIDFEAIDNLNQIKYPPMASVITCWDQISAKNAPIGFGFLTPRSEGIRSLGTVFTSALFAGRCPSGYRLFTSFMGGATDSQVDKLSANDVAQQVIDDIAKCVDIPAQEAQVVASKLWSSAIPQYNKGHLEHLHKIKQAQKKFTGLYLIGNYFSGVSLGDCICNSQESIKPIL